MSAPGRRGRSDAGAPGPSYHAEPAARLVETRQTCFTPSGFVSLYAVMGEGQSEEALRVTTVAGPGEPFVLRPARSQEIERFTL